MSYYVRKINRAKWNIVDSLREEDDINKLNADFLSTCLRTQQGEISLWKINDKNEIDDVVVAICSMGDCIDKVDLVLLNEDELRAIGVEPINSPEGNSKIKEQHYKLIELNYEKIGNFAKVIFNNIDTNKENYKRISASRVQELLANAVINKQIHLPENSKLIEKLKIVTN